MIAHVGEKRLGVISSGFAVTSPLQFWGMASNLLLMASNLLVMASNLVAMASNLLAMASNLVAMA